MATRTITIPPFFYPGTAQIAPTSITVELVNTDGQAIAGFSATNGVIRPRVLHTTDAEQLLTLDVNADLVPFSQWQFTLASGQVSEKHQVTLEAGEPDSNGDIPELLLGDLLNPIA